MVKIGLTGGNGPDIIAVFADSLLRRETPAALQSVGILAAADELSAAPAVTEQMIAKNDTYHYDGLSRRAHDEATEEYRRAAEHDDSTDTDTDAMTDTDLLAWLYDNDDYAGKNKWPWLRSVFPGPAAEAAYQAMVRCLGVLRVRRQDNEIQSLAVLLDYYGQESLNRVFLECSDVALMYQEDDDLADEDSHATEPRP